jgi:hypothetical protein
MLDRQVVKEFLQDELEGIEVTKGISTDDLVEAFCRYTEDYYYEWLKDNFKTFFDRENPDWNWIKERIDYYSKR